MLFNNSQILAPMFYFKVWGFELWKFRGTKCEVPVFLQIYFENMKRLNNYGFIHWYIKNALLAMLLI